MTTATQKFYFRRGCARDGARWLEWRWGFGFGAMASTCVVAAPMCFPYLSTPRGCARAVSVCSWWVWSDHDDHDWSHAVSEKFMRAFCDWEKEERGGSCATCVASVASRWRRRRTTNEDYIDLTMAARVPCVTCADLDAAWLALWWSWHLLLRSVGRRDIDVGIYRFPDRYPSKTLRLRATTTTPISTNRHHS